MLIFAMITSLFGTIIGAIIALAFRKQANDFIALTLGFSGGVVLGIVFLDLVPEVLKARGVIFLSFYFIVGVIIFVAIRLLMTYSKSDVARVSLMTAIAIMLHNFPEGIIMGIGFSSASVIGFEMAIMIIIHDIPEGIALVSTMMIEDRVKSKLKTMLYVFLTELPTAIGLLIGLASGGFGENFINMNFALAAGIMSYVCIVEMIPEAFINGKYFKDIILSIVLGLFVSIMIILIVR
ncbi:MAG: ZIP family metal transporter [Oscillospiraceae bacterium]|nr:ZIP family metal transporter [Oscillospiraceae bacterium]